MDGSRFDALTRFLATQFSRRGAAPLTASLLAAPLLAATAAEAKKKNKKKKKLKKRKKKCNKNPDTKWCKNKCLAVTSDPLNCGACSNACGADAFCNNGVCRTCTVTCEGNNAACGVALQTALDAGGNVVACPGRYVGNFLVDTANVTLIGAGEGDDPASNTILDADQVGRALHIESGFIVTVSNLRITGGNDDGPGGGVRNEGTLTMTSCTIIDNTTTGGPGGIQQNQMATGPLTLTDCTVADNSCDLSGGGIAQANPTHAVTLNNCIVSGNDADAAGGGINVQNGTVNINGGSITDNTAGGEGGGIFNSEFGTVNLDGAEVSGNSPNQCTNVPGC